jgi:hypothetical protein
LVRKTNHCWSKWRKNSTRKLLDLQGRKLATLLDSPHGTSLPVIDLSPYPSGTYLVKINFERGVSVVRKVVRM